MKKLFLMILMAGFIFSAHAQELGIKGGLNLANARASFDGESETGDMAIDFHLGGYAEFGISDLISFQPEVIYSREGFKDDILEETIRLQVNVIQIPLIVKFHVAQGFNLQIGPQPGFIVSTKAKADGSSENIDEGFNTFVFGAVGGAGFEVSEKIEVGGRYNLGISDWLDDGDSDFKTTSNVIQFYLSYRLR
jgi:hypothetical protein